MLDRIADLPGWGEPSSQNLAESIINVASEGVPLSRYIYSIGIPLIGTHVSQLVVSKYGNVESFSEALDEASLYNHDDTVLEEEEGEESMKTPFDFLIGDDGSIKVKVIGPTDISALLSFSKEDVLMKSAKDLENVLTVNDDNNRKLINATINNEDGGTAHQQPSQFSVMTVVFI